MGGEGAMMSMINSLKNNNRRRKNHVPFSKNNFKGYSKEKPVYDFPKATPEVIESIKSKMVKEKRTQLIKIIVIFVFIISIIINIIK